MFLFLLATLATWSIGRFIQTDTLTDPLRGKVSDRLQNRPTLHYLLFECLWCLSFWVAIPVTALIAFSSAGRWDMLLWPLAIRVIAGMAELVEEILWNIKDLTITPETGTESPNIYVDGDAEGNRIS